MNRELLLAVILAASCIAGCSGEQTAEGRTTRPEPVATATPAIPETSSDAMATASGSSIADEIEAVHRQHWSPRFVPARPTELRLVRRLFEDLFGALLAGQDAGSIHVADATRALCDSLALTIEKRELDDQTFLLVRETTPTRGWGVTVIRWDAAPGKHPWMLQAPHARHDRDTGSIATKLFAESGASVVILNGSPRKSSVGETGSPIPSPGADVCHRDDGVYHRITNAFAHAFPRGRVVQIHGFAASKRTSAAGKTASVIVSSGSRIPGIAREVAIALRASAATDWNVLLYPRDVRELGGTTNAQGKHLRRVGFSGFLHLELSREIRLQLLDDVRARRILIAAVTPGTEGRR